jgi:superfamily II DNA/RNA helicase
MQCQLTVVIWHGVALQLQLEAAHTLVLDECDELLRGSMGHQVSLIQSQFSEGYKCIAVSATPSLQTTKLLRQRYKS